jgi:hypothetical protein
MGSEIVIELQDREGVQVVIQALESYKERLRSGIDRTKRLLAKFEESHGMSTAHFLGLSEIPKRFLAVFWGVVVPSSLTWFKVKPVIKDNCEVPVVLDDELQSGACAVTFEGHRLHPYFQDLTIQGKGGIHDPRAEFYRNLAPFERHLCLWLSVQASG